MLLGVVLIVGVEVLVGDEAFVVDVVGCWWRRLPIVGLRRLSKLLLDVGGEAFVGVVAGWWGRLPIIGAKMFGVLLKLLRVGCYC